MAIPQLPGAVLEEMLAECPRILAELNRAAAADDEVSMRRAAHTLRGSLQFFGLTEAIQLAEKIETLARAGKSLAAVELLPAFHIQVGGVLAEIKRRLDSKNILATD